jgi:NMT1-like family
MNGFASSRRRAMGALAMLAALTAPAAAQDKVKVGVFPVSSTLPYFVAVERGFFKEQNIETEMVRLIGGPPNVAAMITNQIDASAVLVTIEGMNANIKKPGVAMYISVNSQNRTYQMEQFVAQGISCDLAQGPQRCKDHVRARPGKCHHGESSACGGRAQGG